MKTDREKKIENVVRIISYVLVVTVWVALLDSGWLVLWGADASWHSYSVVIGWAALTVRRVMCDLGELVRHTWWIGWAAGMRDMAGRDAQGQRK